MCSQRASGGINTEMRGKGKIQLQSILMSVAFFLKSFWGGRGGGYTSMLRLIPDCIQEPGEVTWVTAFKERTLLTVPYLQPLFYFLQ